VGHKYNGAIFGFGSFAQLGNGVSEINGVVTDVVLRCGREEVRDIGVIPKRDNARFWDIVLKEMSGPEYTRGLVYPGGLAVASNAVYKYNTAGPQMSESPGA